jgi:hypothetical protein
VTTTVTPARQRRRAVGRLLQKVQHALPGILLMSEGVHSLQAGAHGWHLALAIAEVATSAVVFIALIKAIRQLRDQTRGGAVPHLHTGIDWVDIFLGVMVFTEAWAKYVETGHIARPTILLGVVMVVLGVFGGKFLRWKQGRGHAQRPN